MITSAMVAAATLKLRLLDGVERAGSKLIDEQVAGGDLDPEIPGGEELLLEPLPPEDLARQRAERGLVLVGETDAKPGPGEVPGSAARRPTARPHKGQNSRHR